MRPQTRAAAIWLVVLLAIIGGAWLVTSAQAPASVRASASVAPSATPTATVAASASAPPAAVPSARATQVAPGTFENKVLGYRITLPVNYRLARSVVIRGQPELLGLDDFTTTTEAQEKAACMQDRGDIPTASDGEGLGMWAYRNVGGVGPAEWVRSRPESTHRTIEPATVGGYEAVRLVQQGEVQLFVIRANDRMYVLSPSLWPTQQPLATIAQSFVAIAPAPFPTPTPVPSLAPRDAAAAYVRDLAAAFAAKDADAVGRLIGARCWIGVGAVVGGSSTGGALNRSVALFVAGLRDRFAAGDLTVTVDPLVQVRTDRGGAFFAVSQWKEPDRTVRIDLDLAELDGQWLWIGATHYYPALIGRGCIPYRSPWVSPSTPAGQC
jgi:hypothetical protein